MNISSSSDSSSNKDSDLSNTYNKKRKQNNAYSKANKKKLKIQSKNFATNNMLTINDLSDQIKQSSLGLKEKVYY